MPLNCQVELVQEFQLPAQRRRSSLPQRLGLGDGERKTLLPRQTAFEPLPASVSFALDWPLIRFIAS
jgi:hypothetical protein